MAALEPDRLVVRVVYAGAPLAGKTASVRAIMPLLKGPGAERLVLSPAEDRGRTAFFDWADYEGGTFEGRPIHCQIASAPGQVALSDRRELVLRGADAVILVVDSRADAIERTLQCYEEMAPWLEEAGREAPIRVLLQCNKQDVQGCLTPAQLTKALGLPFGKDVYATSARTTKGIRNAFVAGVRAAVERARLLLDRGLIASAPEIGSAEELLERMQLDAPGSSPPERARPAPAQSPAVSAPRAAATSAARRAAEKSPRTERRAPVPSTRPSPPLRDRIAGRGRTRRLPSEPAERDLSAPAGSEPSHSPAPAPAARSARAPDPLPEARLRTRPSRARAGGGAPTSESELPAARLRTREAESAAPEPEAREPALAPPPAAAPRSAEPSRSTASSRSAASAAPRSTRDWLPSSGPRPAVMPASVFFALVGPPASREEVEGWGLSEPPLSTPAALQRSMAPAAPAHPSKSAAAARAAVSAVVVVGPGRPAVLPASAYFAALRAAEARGEVTAPSTPVAAASATSSSAASQRTSAPVARPTAGPSLSAELLAGKQRPAVVPASAYFAALRGLPAIATAPDAEAAQPVDAEAPDAAAPQGEAATASAAAPELAAAAPAVPADPLQAERLVRPAVLPLSAWRSGHWTPRAKKSQKVVRLPVVRPSLKMPRPSNARPAVMPLSAWRAAERAAAQRAASAPPPAALTGTAPARTGSASSPPASAVAALDPASELAPFSASLPANDDPQGPESGSLPRASEAAPTGEARGEPRLPGHVAPRATWPRPTWRELAPLIISPGRPRRDPYGRFIGELAPGWYARSLDSAEDLRSGRRGLASAVLRQRSLGAFLSGPRCLALTEEPDGFWIWQIVYRVPTLAVTLGKLLDAGPEPGAMADVLLEVASGYLEAREKFAAAPEPLPLSLQALSAQEGKLVYAGLLPKVAASMPPPHLNSNEAFEQALRRKWPDALSPSIDAGAVVAELQRKAEGRLPDPIVEIIRDVLIRH